ncbi:hypothetical protein ACIQHY_12585 [Streptomyces sp. NPDC092359]|uniref:hypothetical protein n=1 Tax=Streptomyces sp. NPDC092359 TaxID=3366014 RepID=UPI0037F3A106
MTTGQEPTTSDWTRAGPVTEPACTPSDPQSGRLLVDYHLRELGIGETRLVGTGKHGRRTCRFVVPEGIGVCRAHVLTEAAWPDGAELCVLVSWSPTAALRRDHQTGAIPPGAVEHWRERIAATAQALRAVGFVVEPSHVRHSPVYHAAAELLVYRMPPGVPARRAPAAADRATAPVPPNFLHHAWTYPDRSPEDIVAGVLHDAGLHTYCREPPLPSGRTAVRSITQTVWPPEADRCTWLTWSPDPAFVRDPDTGLLPDGAEEHWRGSLHRIREVLTASGLTLRTRPRPWHPATDQEAHYLVHRRPQERP